VAPAAEDPIIKNERVRTHTRYPTSRGWKLVGSGITPEILTTIEAQVDTPPRAQ
jgi:hypothetical protein